MSDTNSVTRAGDIERQQIRQAIERPVPMPCTEHVWKVVSFDVVSKTVWHRCARCGELEKGNS